MGELVTGMAHGPDRLGEQWGVRNGVKIARFPADWSKGRGAGLERNKRMADYGDLLLAFWDGKSRGTRHMIDQMHKRNKPFVIYYWYMDGGFQTEEEWHDHQQGL